MFEFRRNKFNLFLYSLVYIILGFNELSSQQIENLNKTLSIDSDYELLTLTDHIYFLEDKNQNLTINDILKKENQEKFKLNQQNVFIRPSTESAYWFKISLQNNTQKDVWIEVGNSLLWYVDFYSGSGSEYNLITSTGALRPNYERTYPSNLFLFPIGNHSQPQVIYLRTFTERRVNINIQAGTLLAIANNSSKYQTIVVSFITTFIFLLLLNSFFLYISKNRSYLFYICYIASGFPGLLYLYNFPIQTFTINQEFGFFLIKYPFVWINIPFAFVSLLAIRILNLTSESIERKILRSFAFYFLLLSPLFDLASMSLTTNFFPISQLIAIINLLILVGLGIRNWVNTSNRSTRFFVLGWISLLLGLILYQLTSLGIIEYSLFNRSALLVGSTFECIFFSISIIGKSDLFQLRKVEDLNSKLELNTEIFDSLSEYIAVTDLNGNILRVNQAWKDFDLDTESKNGFIGIQEGTNYFEAIENNYLVLENNNEHNAMKGIQAVIESEATEFNLEYPYNYRSEKKWFLMNVSRLQGSILGLVITHINISKRKKSEIERTLAKDLLNSALEAIAEGILITDGKKTILQTNKKFQMMFQISDDTLLTQDEELLNSEIFQNVGNPAEAKARIEEIYQNRNRKSFDILELNDGELYERYSHPLYHEFEIVGRVWSFRDVTARVEVTNDLFAWKRFITTVTDAIPGLVSYWTTNLKCTFANYRYEEWYSKSQSSIVGHHIRDLEGESSYLTKLPYIQKVLDGEEIRYESQILDKYNQPIDLWTHFIPDKHRLTGKVVGFIILVSDISEIKTIQSQLEKAKEKAEAATQAKSEFLATMSHEIRTPLNGVIGFTDLLLQTELSTEQDRYLRIVSNSSIALLSLLNNILDFSKIEAGKLDFAPILGDIKTVAKQAVDVISFQAREKNLSIIENYSDDLPNRLFFDPVRFRQIMINLLSNAVKFTHEGEVELSIQLLKDNSENGTKQLLISIRDTGIGISKLNEETIFEPFSQGDSSTTREFGGTGLGLAISNRLLNLMGSKLELESELGKGSKFFFNLELTSTSRPLQLTKNSSSLKKGISLIESKKNVKFLIVDDDDVNLFLLKSILETILPDPDIIFASNGKIAIEAFSQNNPDIIFMDMQMPVLSGLEATVEIRKLEKGIRIPIIALTAASFQTEIEKCYLAGMNDYAIKPIKKDSIIQILNKWLVDEPR